MAELKEPITVNCICPGMSRSCLSKSCFGVYLTTAEGLVDTGLTGLFVGVSPPEYVTPHSTIVKAVEVFLDDDSKNGLVAECSGEKIYYRDQHEWADDKAKWVMSVSFDKAVQPE